MTIESISGKTHTPPPPSKQPKKLKSIAGKKSQLKAPKKKTALQLLPWHKK